MKLSTGKVAFPIEFDNGDKAVIYFNPADPGLVLRFEELQSKIVERTKKMCDFEIDTNGEPKNESEYSLFGAFTSMVCEEINRAFGNDVSSILFKYVNPLAIVEGDYYIIYVINKLLPEIERHVRELNKVASDKVREYTKGYAKK